MLLMLDIAKLLKNSVGCAFAAGFLLKNRNEAKFLSIQPCIIGKILPLRAC